MVAAANCSLGSTTFFVIFAHSTHSGTGYLCQLLRSHNDVTCDGELFAAKSLGAQKARHAARYTIDAQKADPAGFLAAHFARCGQKACGLTVLPSHLPSAAVPKLFPPGCSVSKLLIQRQNATAEYLLWQEAALAAARANASASGGSGGGSWASSMTLEKYLKQRAEYYARVAKIAPRAPSMSVVYEQLVRGAQSPAADGDGEGGRGGTEAGAASPRESAHAVFKFLGVGRSSHRLPLPLARSEGGAGGGAPAAAAPTPVSAAGAKAAAKLEEERSALSHRWERERRRSAVEITGSITFVGITLSGICLTLGVALGQRYPKLGRRLEAEGAGHGHGRMEPPTATQCRRLLADEPQTPMSAVGAMGDRRTSE